MSKAYVTEIMEEQYRQAAVQNLKSRRSRTSAKAIDTLIDLGSCPRSVDEVYSLGIKFQYCLGDIYLELSAAEQGNSKNFYKEQAMKQLDIKNEINKLANENLNQLLAYFYDNGGPIIEPPVSEQMAKEMQPFFNRIAANSLNQISILVDEAKETNAEDLVEMINNTIINMYTAMSKLFMTDIEDVRGAFNHLVVLQMN